ncbi:MAG TPA: hypothetical protein VM529_07330 [Gemmata sp.]|nr:hypothetical protein [Gemmata sp.]
MRSRVFAGLVALAAAMSAGCGDSKPSPAAVPDKLLEPPAGDQDVNPKTGKPRPASPDRKKQETSSDG